MSAKETVKTVSANPEVVSILEAETTKSAKIRALYAMNIKKGEIAILMNIRYQHVRNVLLQPVKEKSVVVEMTKEHLGM